MKKQLIDSQLAGVARRRFMQGIGLDVRSDRNGNGGAMPAACRTSPSIGLDIPAVLSGTEFDLRIDDMPMNAIPQGLRVTASLRTMYGCYKKAPVICERTR